MPKGSLRFVPLFSLGLLAIASCFSLHAQSPSAASRGDASTTTTAMRLALSSSSQEGRSAPGAARSSKAEVPLPAGRVTTNPSRFSWGIRGGFALPQDDLRLTTEPFPDFAVGAFAQIRLGKRHALRPVADWLHFSKGHQFITTPSEIQTIDTKVSALLFGGEYLYRPGWVFKNLSAGGGVYLMRWSVDSVNTLTLIPDGTAQAAGNSHWMRIGGGPAVSYHFSSHFELQGRWIHSHYGYEHIPVNVAILGAGWRF